MEGHIQIKPRVISDYSTSEATEHEEKRTERIANADSHVHERVKKKKDESHFEEITSDGYRIVRDEQVQAVRVTRETSITDRQLSAIDGFDLLTGSDLLTGNASFDPKCFDRQREIQITEVKESKVGTSKLPSSQFRSFNGNEDVGLDATVPPPVQQQVVVVNKEEQLERGSSERDTAASVTAEMSLPEPDAPDSRQQLSPEDSLEVYEAEIVQASHAPEAETTPIINISTDSSPTRTEELPSHDDLQPEDTPGDVSLETRSSDDAKPATDVTDKRAGKTGHAKQKEVVIDKTATTVEGKRSSKVKPSNSGGGGGGGFFSKFKRKPEKTAQELEQEKERKEQEKQEKERKEAERKQQEREKKQQEKMEKEQRKTNKKKAGMKGSDKSATTSQDTSPRSPRSATTSQNTSPRSPRSADLDKSLDTSTAPSTDTPPATPTAVVPPVILTSHPDYVDDEPFEEMEVAYPVEVGAQRSGVSSRGRCSAM